MEYRATEIFCKRFKVTPKQLLEKLAKQMLWELSKRRKMNIEIEVRGEHNKGPVSPRGKLALPQ